jgi:hypothetical protein
MKMNGEDLVKFAGERFSNQSKVLTLWQTLAEHFYPERSDFTNTHNLGEELGIGLASSQPVLIRRELGDSFGAMLRDGHWFDMGVDGEADHMGKMWLEYATHTMFRAMNNRAANFRRATKQGDHDYATFGNAVLSVELNKRANGLLYRNWHLKDCAWWDNDEEAVDGVVRRWNMKIHEMQKYFKEDELPTEVKKKIAKHKLFDENMIYHFDMPSEMYGHEEFSRYERVSLFVDVQEKEVIRAVGKNYRCYAVPRFFHIAGSPYAYSPATVVGLPEARTIQSMTHTLLEAGERLTRPPLIATHKAIRGDANLFSDGITYISEEFDGDRGRDAIRPLETTKGGFPYGMDMREGVIEVLQSAFYTNKINLPETTHEMTAYEVQERMKQYRRENLPLFAPIEHEYNGQLCEMTFDVMMENGLLGSHEDIPESLREKDVEFKFKSPLSASEEEKKAATFSQVSQLLREAAEFDETASMNIDFDEALRDAVAGVGAPAKWLTEVDELEKRREQYQQEKSAMIAAEQEGDQAPA